MQSREGPCSISALGGMCVANVRGVWECGLAHEVVVARNLTITSWMSEGPLGFRGHGGCGVLGNIALVAIKFPGIKKLGCACCGEACGKPVVGKAAGDMRELETGLGKSRRPGF